MSAKFRADRKQFFKESDFTTLVAPFVSLFSDVIFYVKDRYGRYIMCNDKFCELCKVHSKSEIIGKTDYDFRDPFFALLYCESDKKVIEKESAIINKVELIPDVSGFNKLVVCSKFPVKNHYGETIGVAGAYREVDEHTDFSLPHKKLEVIVQRIHRQYSEKFNFRDLARSTGMTYKDFMDRFKNLFRVTPSEYLARVRVQAACKNLLNTNWTITEIALKTGFYDHSHLIRVFSRYVGVSPSSYRLTYSSLNSSS